jgi:hypothetical protein
MYKPGEFTHQGVRHPLGVTYPGTIAGKYWDKAQLEITLQPVVEFQKKYGVHIYIGEISAIRWAPDNSAYRYLKDLIEIFRSHNWDWSYTLSVNGTAGALNMAPTGTITSRWQRPPTVNSCFANGSRETGSRDQQRRRLLTRASSALTPSRNGCRTPDEIRRYTRRKIDRCFADGFWALGTGNSLTNYMPVENYLIVLEEGLNC